jgi:nitrous-oxide reductase
MRILKYIGVFTPEPWQGYGYDENRRPCSQGRIDGKDITWGDTHHPAMSETNGEYDGQFLFINDKANPRLAVIDLRDFETKQIVVNPIFKSEHGGAFVSPNTDYVIEAAQYAAPLENKKFYPLEEFNEKYRGGVTYWKFDRKKGRIDPRRASRSNCRRTARTCPTSARARRRLELHQQLLLRALCGRHREGPPAL